MNDSIHHKIQKMYSVCSFHAIYTMSLHFTVLSWIAKQNWSMKWRYPSGHQAGLLCKQFGLAVMFRSFWGKTIDDKSFKLHMYQHHDKHYPTSGKILGM